MRSGRVITNGSSDVSALRKQKFSRADWNSNRSSKFSKANAWFAHGYRSDEHLNLILLADEFGFKVASLQHGLEAYKIAPEIAKRGTGVSIFVIFRGYKIEAYDAIPYNAYILWKNGVNVSINSDSAERIRRLNLDAAKVMKYGTMPEREA